MKTVAHYPGPVKVGKALQTTLNTKGLLSVGKLMAYQLSWTKACPVKS